VSVLIQHFGQFNTSMFSVLGHTVHVSDSPTRDCRSIITVDVEANERKSVGGLVNGRGVWWQVIAALPTL